VDGYFFTCVAIKPILEDTPLPDRCFAYPLLALLSPLIIIGLPIILILLGVLIYYVVPIYGSPGLGDIDLFPEVDIDRLFDGLQLFNSKGTKQGSPFNRQLFTNSNNIDESIVLDHIIQTAFPRMAKQSIQFILDDIDQNHRNDKSGEKCHYRIYVFCCSCCIN
jgi:hypothetical protein